MDLHEIVPSTALCRTAYRYAILHLRCHWHAGNHVILDVVLLLGFYGFYYILRTIIWISLTQISPMNTQL